MSFSTQSLLATLRGLPAPSSYCVALSGGLDSSVLLHALAALREELAVPVSALHVDHGLQLDSMQWGEHCLALCQSLSVPLRRVRVEVGCCKEKGLEASARAARYRVFEDELFDGQMLLSAHHRNDQAETLLLQLLRGGGAHGLAGMPLLRALGRGWLARPLLAVGRNALQAYADASGLGWIDDPSNRDIRWERNYIRHHLLPQLQQRRVGIVGVLARSAGHFAEDATLLDELAETDLAVCRQDGGLAIPSLLALSPARQRNLIRYFLRSEGLGLPDHRRLQAIQTDLLAAASDARPLVNWPGTEIRRYRDILYAMSSLPVLPGGDWEQGWDGSGTVVLPNGLGEFRLQERRGQGLRAECLRDGAVVLRLRRGGERLQLPGQTLHHSLKHCLQQAGIPPWRRERLPLLYIDGELAQVAGLWTAARFACEAGQTGLMLERTDSD